MRLRVAAKVDPADRAYFDREIRALFADPLVDYIGEIGEAEKGAFIGGARAMLFPVDWPEPFGLVMIEAMACGTPVVAYDCGSVPEVLQHGVTGYVVRNQEEAIAAAQGIGRLDRCACRAQFEQRFTADRMARRYVEVYRSLLDGRMPLRWPMDDIALDWNHA
jgi:glycosyltransferase involved in cell wall biosynthesis